MPGENRETTGGAWTLLCLAGSQVEGNIIKGRLEAADIPAMLFQEAIGKFYGLLGNGLGATRVMVPAHLEKKARRVLSEAGGGAG